LNFNNFKFIICKKHQNSRKITRKGGKMIKIHEYQAKTIFAKYNIPLQKGVVISSINELDNVKEKLGEFPWAVKAQILAGGRGKAGGVKVLSSFQEVKEMVEKLLGKPLVTKQTGPQGEIVKKILIEKANPIEKELYLAVVLDRIAGKPTILASKEGGVEIEQLAKEKPEAILKEQIDPIAGLFPHQARNIAYGLNLPSSFVNQAAKVIQAIAKIFIDYDASLVEINPLAVTKEGIIAIDAKMNFDENALFRHPEIQNMMEEIDIDTREKIAKSYGLSYISLNGNIGCLVNGAGLAMTTMDIIKFHGGEPANFLDVGGGASTEAVIEGFKLILSDPKVKAILVNIFGGIMKCDVIATGIVEAAKQVKVEVPIVVRLEGTNVELGREILKKSNLNIITANDLDDAAKKAVEYSHKA
jgi:succinyl-CoA synthetase beta subunit